MEAKNAEFEEQNAAAKEKALQRDKEAAAKLSIVLAEHDLLTREQKAKLRIEAEARKCAEERVKELENDVQKLTVACAELKQENEDEKAAKEDEIKSLVDAFAREREEWAGQEAWLQEQQNQIRGELASNESFMKGFKERAAKTLKEKNNLEIQLREAMSLQSAHQSHIDDLSSTNRGLKKRLSSSDSQIECLKRSLDTIAQASADSHGKLATIPSPRSDEAVSRPWGSVDEAAGLPEAEETHMVGEITLSEVKLDDGSTKKRISRFWRPRIAAKKSSSLKNK